MNRKIVGLCSALVISMSSALADQKMDDCAMLPNAEHVVRVNCKKVVNSQFGKMIKKVLNDKKDELMKEAAGSIGSSTKGINSFDELIKIHPEVKKYYDNTEIISFSLSVDKDENFNKILELKNAFNLEEFTKDFERIIKREIERTVDAADLKKLKSVKISYDKKNNILTIKVAEADEAGEYDEIYFGTYNQYLIIAEEKDILLATQKRMKSGVASQPHKNIVKSVAKANTHDIYFASAGMGELCDGVRAIVLTGKVDVDLETSITARFTNEEKAKEILQQIQGTVAMAGMFIPQLTSNNLDNQESKSVAAVALVNMVSSIKFARNKKAIRITIPIKNTDMKTLLENCKDIIPKTLGDKAPKIEDDDEE